MPQSYLHSTQVIDADNLRGLSLRFLQMRFLGDGEVNAWDEAEKLSSDDPERNLGSSPQQHGIFRPAGRNWPEIQM